MPYQDMPKGEDGQAINPGYYSIDGELFDHASPSPGQLDYMARHDSQVQALVLAIELILLSADFAIDPADGDTGEAELCRRVLLRTHREGGMKTPIRDVLGQMGMASLVKRVYFEKVWRLEPDGTVAYDKIAWRPPEQCTMKVDPKNGSFDGFRQQAPRLDGEPLDEHIKPDKAFVYVFRNYRRPGEGYSLFETAFGDYTDKLKVNRLHNIHLERFALGTIIGTYTGRLKGAARKFFNKLHNWVGGGGVLVLGDSETVRVESHTGAGAEFIEKLRYVDSQMAGAVLLGFLRLANEGNSGAYALTRDHREFAVQLIQAILKDEASALTEHVLSPLVWANRGPDAKYPTWRFGELSEAGRAYAAEVWKTLVVAANKPGGKFWEAIEDAAAEHMDVPPEALEADRKAAKDEAGGDGGGGEGTAAGLPAAGDEEAFRRSLEKLVAPVGGPGDSPNGNSPNGNGRG